MTLERYTLYIRRHDQAKRLVEDESGYAVEIASYFVASEGYDLYLLPRGRTGIHLYRDEIELVDEFPPTVIG